MRFEALDLLRLFAVGAVILFHYGFRGASGDDHLTTVSVAALAPLAIYGYLGVKLFFVISGFVISFSAQNRTMFQFGVARACRIYPAFLFCMTVTFLVTLAIGAPVFQASFGKWLLNATIVVPARSLQYCMDGAYWSIYAELVFYAWIAVMIGMGWFARHLTAVVLVWLLLSAGNELVLGSILGEKLLLTNQSGFFAAGVMLFVLKQRGRNLQNIAVLLLAVALGVRQAIDEMPYYVNYVHAPLDARVVAAIAIGSVALVAAATAIKRVPLPSSWVLALGGLTYPLYLLHQNIGYMIFNRLDGAMPSGLLVGGVSAFMLVVSYWTWRYVDRPGQHLMRKAIASLAPHLWRASGLRTQPPEASSAAREL